MSDDITIERSEAIEEIKEDDKIADSEQSNEGETETDAEKCECLYDKLKLIPGIGVILAMITALLSSISSLTVKLVENIPPLEILVARSIICLLIYGTVVAFHCKSIFAVSGERLYLVTRCSLGFISLFLAYEVTVLLPLGDLTAIITSSTVFVGILAFVLLQEPLTVSQILSIVLTTIGIVLICKPSFLFPAVDNKSYKERNIASLLAILAAVFTAFNLIVIRKLKVTESAVNIFWVYFTCASLGLLYIMTLSKIKVPQRTIDYIFIVTNGICSAVGQLLIEIALKLEDAGPVSVGLTTSVLTSYILQILFLSEAISVLSCIGAALIVFGILVTFIQNIYKSHKHSE